MANNNYVCTLTPEQAGELKDILENSGWEFSSIPYARFKASRDHTTVLYAIQKVETNLKNGNDTLKNNIQDITANINSCL